MGEVDVIGVDHMEVDFTGVYLVGINRRKQCIIQTAQNIVTYQLDILSSMSKNILH